MKPGIPKGTRDFSAEDIAKRNFIFNIIKQNFEIYGFEPIETPSFENYDTLMGKYGEEGDRLIFKILKSGDYLSKVDENVLKSKDSIKASNSISDKALRYDLTVPFARYVVQHFNDITLPFKRYQMQPVWRADRPQKGRFREFFQCDADVVGSQSLWQDIEFVQLYDAVFYDLGITDISIHINNRKILSGLAEIIGEQDKIIDLTVALDKLDKIGKDNVIEEWKSKDISEDSIKKLLPLFELDNDANKAIEQMSRLLKDSIIGTEGVEELKFIIRSIESIGLKNAVLKPNFTLARGLNYYTGTILEVTADKVNIGSVGGGGRYDDLTGIFGMKDLSGIGISFGLDRILLAMETLELFSKVKTPRPDVLAINFSDNEALYALKLVNALRDEDIKAELYPDAAKMKKQFSYADKRQIPWIIMAGTREIEQQVITIKNMLTGEQETIKKNLLIDYIKKGIVNL